MRILVITRVFPINGIPSLIGGVSFSLKSFFNTFLKKNHEIMIFILPYKLSSKYKFPYGVYNFLDYKEYIKRYIFSIFINIVRIVIHLSLQKYPIKKKINFILGYIRAFRHLLCSTTLYLLIKNIDKIKNFDIILAYDSQIPAHIGYLLKHYQKKKFITIVHGNDIISSRNHLYTSLVLQNADKIIVRSNYIKILIQKLYNIKNHKISICTDGIILEEFKIEKDKKSLRKELNLLNDYFYILSVGTLSDYRKGFDIVLRAIKELRDSYGINIDKIKYLLIGRDSLPVRKKLNDLAKNYNIEKNLEILVNLDDDLRNKYYKASDIYVMPSRNLINKGSIEGFGNAFIEAGYYSLPSIGSNTGGIPDAIEDGKSGFIVNNFKELVEKIKLLYENEKLRLNMGKFANERVINKFTWNKIYYDYLNVFEKL